MLVHKFGGTSVANADRIKTAADLAVTHGRPCVIVSSAMGGVTDQLINVARLAQERQTAGEEELMAQLRRRHLEAAEALAPEGPKREELRKRVRDLLQELQQILQGVRLLQELSPRSLDLIVSFGERLAVLLVAAAVDGTGGHGCTVDARDIICTDEQFGGATVDMEKSRALAQVKLLPLCADAVPVVTGFIARSPSGATTTLGRGGSDYTASLVGAFLKATEIWIWTDVDGVMTADPRVVPEARVVPAVSYREAAEMAYFGSKVLHPSTMIPAVHAEIPIRIRSSYNPTHQGTLITNRHTDVFEGVKTVTSVPEMALVTVEGKGMIGIPGMVGRIFTATARAGVNVYMISQASSEQNISFLVRGAEGSRAAAEVERELELELERGRIDRVDIRAPVGILAIIGDGMKGTPGISQRLFDAIGRSRINVLAIAQGSSELNVSVVVSQSDLHRAVGAVHTRFGLTQDTHIFLLGKGLIGRTLLSQILAGRERLSRDHGLSLEVVGVCGRDQWLFEPKGLTAEAMSQIAAGSELADLGGEARPTDEAIIERLVESRRLDVVVVDVTAEETGVLHLAAVGQGLHVVSANKKPMSGPLARYRAIRAEAVNQGVGYHYETTFGAGLPVLFTLQDLIATCDRVIRITGCFSGTLGFICSALEAGARFSAAVLEARELGLTEPDPRDDLSGADVARKALIIAREIGIALEMEDIELEPLVTPELMDLPDVASFLRRLPELDESFAERRDEAAAEDSVLRYLAEITPQRVVVGLRVVPKNSAPGQLAGPENILVYQTERYDDNPLVIRGPGAGAEVTAAGVFGDILKIARRS